MTDIEFTTPGPGSWELEQAHFSRPMSRYLGQVFPSGIARGFGEGARRYGLLLDTIKMAAVHDFCYAQFRPVGAPPNAKGPPPKLMFMLLARLHPEIRRRVKTAPRAFDQKLWRDDLREWDEHYKPDSIARNTRLQNTVVEKLGDAELAAHLVEIRDNVAEMLYRHHRFSVAATLPVGHFIVEGQRVTGLSTGELLVLLKGAAPVSRGVGAGEFAGVSTALAQRGITADQYRDQPPQRVLDDLSGRPDDVGSAVRRFLDVVGYRAVLGYDVVERYAFELPEMLVRTIFSGHPKIDTRQAEFQTRRDTIRARIPQADRATFDELLEEARVMHRLRDERGIYQDLWAFGLARRAMLETGRRLKASGVLPDAALATSASHDELLGLLQGARGPEVADLQRRQSWRETKTTADAPPFLGGQPSPPPPVEWLPRNARAIARATNAIIGNMYDVSERKAEARTVEGLAVHPGIYEGPARIISGPQDFNRLQKGDVLVTRVTGPSFNVVLPLLGAIVTDRGGQLSHTAIVAREYGIPAVVGTREATVKIPDGARVRVNGNTGRVELIV